MSRKHALLSASAAGKWFNCPPSARLEETMADESSDYAREGILAHKIAELTIRYRLLNLAKRTYTMELKKLQADPLYAPEMMEHVENFAAYVAECFGKSKSKPRLELEKRLDYSAYAPEGFGTGDVIIASDNLMYLIDFKYGQGVHVSAENNLQLKLYALGALNEYGMFYETESIMTVVFQPRLDNISEMHYQAKDLMEWGENVLKPVAELAFAGLGDFNPGEHCKTHFCKAADRCRARADKHLAMAKYDFADPPLLSDEEIAEILLTAKEMEKWASDIWKFAQAEAINGKHWPNFKLVEGRSNREFVNQEKMLSVLAEASFALDVVAPRKPLGIGDMEKAITRAKFKELLTEKGFVVKPAGKPTLVPMADSRPALGSADEAAQDFNDGFDYQNIKNEN